MNALGSAKIFCAPVMRAWTSAIVVSGSSTHVGGLAAMPSSSTLATGTNSFAGRSSSEPFAYVGIVGAVACGTPLITLGARLSMPSSPTEYS